MSLKIGDIVAYQTVTGELHNAQITYLYDGNKHGDCQIYIPELKQSFDYPINELITKDSMG